MPTTYQPGDVVYCRDGRKAEFVAMDGEQFIIRLAWSRGDQEDEEYFERVTTVHEVWAQPPVEIYAAEVDAARNELSQIEAKVNALYETKHQAERDMKEILAKAERVKGLHNLSLFLDGQINFIVTAINWGKIEVRTREDALREREDGRDWEKKTKLLTLYGNSNGDVAWGLNRWSDGSGSGDALVWPFATREEAEAKAAEIITERCQEYLDADARRYSHYVEVLLASARTLGLTLPDGMLLKAKEAKLASAVAARDEHATKLAVAQAAVDALTKETV